MARSKTTLDDINARKKPRRDVYWIITDQDLADRFEELEEREEQARGRALISPETEGFVSEAKKLKEELDELKEEIRKPENSLKFVFEAMGSRNYDKLTSKHQITPERKEELEAQGRNPDAMPYDPETFAPALIAKSCVEPEGLTPEYVDEVIKGPKFSSGDFVGLYQTALEVNTRRRNYQLGKG